jgi:DNA-directed RNA polymerase subunit alpha
MCKFSVLPGIKEDVITILLNLKKVRISITGNEPQTLTLKAKGIKDVKAGDIKIPGGVEILNPDLTIATLTDKSADLDIEMIVEKGLGFVSKETLQKNRMDIGFIGLDATFTPVRRVSYEVENMRVGDRTDFNRLKLFITTDGTITPKEALEKSIEIMIGQLKAIVGFKEDDVPEIQENSSKKSLTEEKNVDDDVLKTRIDTLNLSARTLNTLSNANIRTVGDLSRKKASDILDIDGMGEKGLNEIKEILSGLGITLKE